MATNSYPDKYALFNSIKTKQLNVIVCVEGLDVCFSLAPTYQRVRYGDPGVKYGDPGLIYGGLKLLDNVKAYLSLESSLVLSQKLEPEQGRASVSTLSLTFIDKDGYFTRLSVPGQSLDELLGDKEVTIKMGYVETSFPEDYFTIWRGYVSAVTMVPSKVIWQLSDSNLKRRQTVFAPQKTKLTASIDDLVTTIPVVKTDRFPEQILGPDGLYDGAIKTLIRIDDELMEYGPGDLTATTVEVTRGVLGTLAEPHDIDAEVDTLIEIEDNVIDMALKIMLSGWQGPFVSAVEVYSIAQTNDPLLGIIPDAIRLSEDAVDTYGLAVGDYFTITGSGVGNNLSGRIIAIQEVSGFPNRLLRTDQTFVVEFPSPGVEISFRSQFDTYPDACSLMLKGRDVDVAKHIELRDNFFSQSEYDFRFLIDEDENGKEFIERELFLPIGAYSITRFGRVSAVATKPPIADERLTFITEDNVVQPETVMVTRGLNVRRFFNEISYEYDKRPFESEFSSKAVLLDTDSLTKIGQSSTLPILSKGMRTTNSAETLIERRGTDLLRRYKDAAYEISLKVNWEAGSLIEAGDVVAIQDNGTLKIPNYGTGDRDLGTQLFEVLERTLDIKTGVAQLKLLSNVGYQATDRFATISPSSIVVSGGTTTQVPITESYGNELDEWRKYEDFVGLPIVVHDYLWTYAYETTLIGFSAIDPNILIVNPPLPAPPVAGDIVDIAEYPDDPDPGLNQTYKVLYCHLDPTLEVVSGTSDTVFDVSLSDAAKAVVGQLIQIHSDDYTIESPEVIVESVVGTQITTQSSLGFTPAAGQKVELVGFRDNAGAYRIV